MGRGCVSGRKKKKQFRNFEFQFSGEFLNLFISSGAPASRGAKRRGEPRSFERSENERGA